MDWLENLSGWTVASWGLGWFAFSTTLALVLGRIIGRTNRATAEQTQVLLPQVAAATAVPAEAPPTESADPWLAGSDESADDEDYGSRATSGTRFKPVALEEQLAKPALRRVR
jgi:hypothetical protein